MTVLAIPAPSRCVVAVKEYKYLKHKSWMMCMCTMMELNVMFKAHSLCIAFRLHCNLRLLVWGEIIVRQAMLCMSQTQVELASPGLNFR